MRQKGFTIVELLVVIVVIGVLAAVTIVSYTGISQRALAASVQSDLDNGSKTLKMHYVDNSIYPTTIDCGQVDSKTNKCIKPSGNNSYGYVSYGTGFMLVSINSKTCYSITENSAPIENCVAIGSQVWMKYNLNIGTMIPGADDQTNDLSIEKYCYNDNEAICITDGGLYQWDEMMNYNTDATGICPSGFHIPTDTEWKTLEKFLGMSDAEANGTGYRGSHLEGQQLKVNGSSGMNIKLSGYRDLPGGNFSDRTVHGVFWLSTQPSSYGYRGFTSWSDQIYRVVYSKLYGMSVRCLLD